MFLVDGMHEIFMLFILDVGPLFEVVPKSVPGVAILFCNSFDLELRFCGHWLDIGVKARCYQPSSKDIVCHEVFIYVIKFPVMTNVAVPHGKNLSSSFNLLNTSSK